MLRNTMQAELKLRIIRNLITRCIPSSIWGSKIRLQWASNLENHARLLITLTTFRIQPWLNGRRDEDRIEINVSNRLQ
jgi:hypothetical protein